MQNLYVRIGSEGSRDYVPVRLLFNTDGSPVIDDNPRGGSTVKTAASTQLYIEDGQGGYTNTDADGRSLDLNPLNQMVAPAEYDLLDSAAFTDLILNNAPKDRDLLWNLDSLSGLADEVNRTIDTLSLTKLVYDAFKSHATFDYQHHYATVSSGTSIIGRDPFIPEFTEIGYWNFGFIMGRLGVALDDARFFYGLGNANAPDTRKDGLYGGDPDRDQPLLSGYRTGRSSANYDPSGVDPQSSYGRSLQDAREIVKGIFAAKQGASPVLQRLQHLVVSADADNLPLWNEAVKQLLESIADAADRVSNLGNKPPSQTPILILLGMGKDLNKAYVNDVTRSSDTGINEALKNPGARGALVSIAAQYAADLIERSSKGDVPVGSATNLDESRNLLTINLDPKAWPASYSLDGYSGGNGKIVGRDALLNNLFFNAGLPSGTVQRFLRDVAQPKVSTSKDRITTIDIGLKGAVVLSEGNAPSSFDGASGGVLLIGGKDTQLLQGGKGDDILVAGSSQDTLDGAEGANVLIGGRGQDTFLLGKGSNVVAGGTGAATASFEKVTTPLMLTLKKGTFIDGGQNSYIIDNLSGNTQDTLFNVKTVKLGSGNDAVKLTGALPSDVPSLDGGGGINTLDLSGLSKGVKLAGDRLDGFSARISNFQVLKGTNLGDTITGSNEFKQLDLGNGNNLVANLSGPDLTKSGSDPQSTSIGAAATLAAGGAPSGGGGGRNNWVRINLGSGSSTVGGGLAAGSEVYAGAGHSGDVFELSPDTRLHGLNPTDRLTWGGTVLTGGVRNSASDSPWAYSYDHLIQYGFNGNGDLVIQTPSHFAKMLGGSGDFSTYVAGFDRGSGRGSATATAHISAIQVTFTAGLLLKTNLPANWFDQTMEVIFGDMQKAWTGTSTYAGVDPLVLDLGGKGVATSALERDAAERFDINGDGFANPTGWIGASQGFLVHLDTAPDGTVTSVKQLFGNPSVDGFVQLAAYDTNGDGRIDALDAGWSSLRIWQDLDGNHQVDTGELVTLEQAGVASISLTATPLTHRFDQGNQIRATATFTRTDGTTGTIADVMLHTDNFNSTYLGQTSVSATAAALPDVKGHGTLLDLHAAMTVGETQGTDAAGNPVTLPSALETAAQTALQGFVPGTDITAWRAVMLPVLKAWTAALPDPKPSTTDWWTQGADSSGKAIQGALTGRPDAWIVVKSDAGGNTVMDDVEYQTETVVTNATDPITGQVTSISTTYGFWGFGSGRAVTDAQGTTIVHPTLDQVRATPLNPGEGWSVIRASELDFLERFLGEKLPLGRQANSHAGVAANLTPVLNTLNNMLDMVTLRFAVQAPALAAFFGTIQYDIATDGFSARTDLELVPMYRAIFAAAPAEHDAQVAYLAAWKTVVADLLPGFTRSGGRAITDSFLLGNIVAGWESAPGALTLLEAAGALGCDPAKILTGTSVIEGSAKGGDLAYIGAGITSVHDRMDVPLSGTPEVYVVGGTFGHVVLDQSETVLAGQANILRFATLRSTELTATRDGTDLVFATLDGSQSLRLKDQFVWDHKGTRFIITGTFADHHGVDSVIFADGVTWDANDIGFAVAQHGTHDQLIQGTSGHEVLFAGPNDTLQGGGGADIYVFQPGFGHDTIAADIDANGGYDDPVTGKYNTVLFGADITLDSLAFFRDGGSDDLVISIKGTQDQLTIKGQFSYTETGVFGGFWFTRIDGFVFSDGATVSANQLMPLVLQSIEDSGATSVYGYKGDDTLDGASGTKYLSGDDGNDLYLYNLGYGDQVIEDKSTNILIGTNDTIRFGAGITQDNITLSRPEGTEDLVITFADGHALTVRNEFNPVRGFNIYFDKIENFEFADGSKLTDGQVMDRIVAEAASKGDTTVTGFNRTDKLQVLDDPHGNVLLRGEDRENIYVFDRGYGHDTIFNNYQMFFLWEGESLVRFGAGIRPEDVVISCNQDDTNLVLSIRGTDDQLTVLDSVVRHSGSITNIAWHAIGRFEFTDGTVWTRLDIQQRLLDQAASEDILTVSPFFGDYTYSAVLGDKHLKFEEGSNTFRYTSTAGNVTIEGPGTYGSPQKLVLTDIASTGVSRITSNANHDLVINILATGKSITVLSNFGPGNTGFQGVTASGYIGSVTFSDGVTWTPADLISAMTTSMAGDEALYGTVGADVFDPKGYTHYINGQGGGDTIAYNAGYGALEVHETHLAANTDNVLKFGPGITKADVVVSFDLTGDILLNLGNNDIVTLDGETSYYGGDGLGMQVIQFSDGTSWSQDDLIALTKIVNGTTGADRLVSIQLGSVFDGKGGDDYAVGLGGGDIFVFNKGYGHLTLEETGYRNPGSTANNTLSFGAGIGPSSVAVRIVNDQDVLLTIGDGADQVLISHMMSNQGSMSSPGIDQVLFADGTSWSQGQVVAMAAAAVTVIQGSPGYDYLVGTARNDLFDGKGGYDYEVGAGGNDTFVFDRGYGDLTIYQYATGSSTVRLGPGIVPSGVSVTGSAYDNDAYLNTGIEGDRIRLRDAFNAGSQDKVRIEFADGTVWDRQVLVGKVLAGTQGADIIYGTQGADLIDGQGGADYEGGKGGGDTFVFERGYGQLEVNEADYGGTTPNILQLGPTIVPSEVTVEADAGGDILLRIGANGDQVLLDGMAPDPSQGVQQVRFADGTTWDRSALLAKQMAGTAGADVIYGTAGADLIDGHGGGDTVHGQGGGDTFVFDAGYGRLEVDEADFGSDPQNLLQLGAGIALSDVAVAADAQGNLVLTIGGGDQVVLDGMVYSPSSGVQQVQFADGIVLIAQQLLVLASNGSAGADFLFGTTGDDTLDGKGAPVGLQDYLQGNGGADTFVFNAGYGRLEISEDAGFGTNSAATLQLGAGIDVATLKVSRDASGNVFLTDGTAGDQVTLDAMLSADWSGHTQHGVAQVQYADGTMLSRQQITDLTMAGTADAETLYGTAGAEVLDGKGAPAGLQDNLQGGGGADTFVFNAGYGHLEIGEDAGSYTNSAATLQFGAGVTPASLGVSADGYGNLFLTDGVAGDQVEVDGMLNLGYAGYGGSDTYTEYGVGQVQFADGTTWTRSQVAALAGMGTAGSDTIGGTSGNDLLDGRGGGDTISGEGGNDVYFIRQGYGTLAIDNATSDGTAARGEVDFGPGITKQSLWFSRSGNDLIANVLGSADAVDVQGWFGTTPSAQLAGFRAFDGLELDSQVGQLTTAMAAYVGANPGFDPATATAMPDDPALRSVLATSWHG